MPSTARGSYLGIAKLWDAASDDVSQWTSPSPVGPGTYSGRLATTPIADDAITYGGRVVMLPGNLPVVVYSVNLWDATALDDDVLRDGARVGPYVDPASTGARTAAP